ncbi:hypothetical protein M2275_005474 [Rhodococcus opacus]|nr:hypothetical protein [Rhodococcus opacus]
MAGHADPAADLGGVDDDVQVLNLHAADGGPHQGGEGADQGGLAGTVVAEHTERGPGGSLQVDTVEGPRRAVGDVQILDHDGRRAHRTPPNR